MAISQVPPLSSNVPIVYPPGHPSAGCPTPAFATLMQILLDEKAITDALAQGAIQPGTVTTSGLTAAAQRILGNKEATTGAIEELTLSQVLDLIGSAAQGDLLFRGSAGWQRLAAGTSGQFLKTLGTGADPAWAAASGGGGSTLIEEYVADGTTGTHAFSSIPGTYRELRLMWTVRSDVAATSDSLNIQLNGDTGAHYDYQIVRAVASAASGIEGVGQSQASIGLVSGDTAPTGVAASGMLEIPYYASTTLQKAGFSNGSSKLANSTGNFQIRTVAFWWRDTSAISSLTAALSSGKFKVGSKLALYGIS